MTGLTVRPHATQRTAEQPRTPMSSGWRRWVLGYGWCLALILPAMARAEMLDDLISQVLVSHPATRSQRALVASATAGVDSARWQFYPTPSARLEAANASPNDRLYQGDIQSSTLSLQQPLWTGGRLSSGLNKARAALTVSEAGLEEVRHKLALQVLQAYGEWMSASLQTLANEKSLATHVQLRAQVERRIA
jgi:adhesin transport system outer membrane protein